MLEKQRILLTDVPEQYIKVTSGLGEAPPRNIVVLPVLFEGEVLAVVELASFNRFSDIHLTFLDQLTESIGIVLNMLAIICAHCELLKQSQSLTQELQNRQLELQVVTNSRLELQAQSLQASEEYLKEQQEELQQTNEELKEKAELLAQQNREVERKNREIEMARQEVEEKGGTVGAHLQVQVRIPRKHVARTAHSIEQFVDPFSPAGREWGIRTSPRSKSNTLRQFTPPATTCSP